jgi:MFS family permease
VDTTGNTEGSLGRSWVVLIIATLSAMFLYAHSTSFAPFLTVVADDLGVDPGRAAQIFTARLWGDAFFLLFCGVLADKFGVRFVVAVGSLVTVAILACLLFFGTSLNVVLFLYFMLGLPGGMIFPCISSLCVNWLPGRYHGLAGGIFMCLGVTAGYGLGPLLGPYALELTGHWRSAVFSLATLNILIAILALIFITKPTRVFFKPEATTSLATGEAKPSMLKLLLLPITIVGSLAVVCSSWSYMGIANYVSTIVAEAPPIGMGRGEFMGGRMAVILSLASIVGGLLGGFIYDRIFKGRGRPQFLVGILLQTAVFLILLGAFRESLSAFAMVIIACGVGAQLFTPVTYATASKVYPEGTASTMVGLWWGIGTWGSGLGLYLCGRSLERTGNLDSSIVNLGVAALVGFLLILFFWRERFLKAKV